MRVLKQFMFSIGMSRGNGKFPSLVFFLKLYICVTNNVIYSNLTTTSPIFL